MDTVFDDAALASLSLTDPHGSGVGLDPAFSSGHTGYEATFGRGVTVRVHAEVRDPGATFVIEPRFDQSDQSAGHDVLLTPGRATEITVTVTAEDRTTRRTYTVQLVNAIVTLAVTPSRIGEDGGSATVTATIDPPFSSGGARDGGAGGGGAGREGGFHRQRPQLAGLPRQCHGGHGHGKDHRGQQRSADVGQGGPRQRDDPRARRAGDRDHADDRGRRPRGEVDAEPRIRGRGGGGRRP